MSIYRGFSCFYRNMFHQKFLRIQDNTTKSKILKGSGLIVTKLCCAALDLVFILREKEAYG